MSGTTGPEAADEDVQATPEPAAEEPGDDVRDGLEEGKDAEGEGTQIDGQGTEGADDAPRIAELEAEVARLNARLARARADYENLQKRQERDAALERDRVRARVLEDFLQVYEYGKMAEFEADRNPGPLAQGVKMVVREFDRLLENHGLRPVGAVGEPFNPEEHEAFETEAREGVEPGCISKVIQPGYRLGERVLRYAKVAVAPSAAKE